MNEIERNLMKGMVSILNEAAEAYYNTGNPIMSDEMYDMRRHCKAVGRRARYMFNFNPKTRKGKSNHD